MSRTTKPSTGTGFIIDLGGEFGDGSRIHPDEVKRLYQSVFRPRTPRNTNWHARFVLTCAHCVENCGVGEIRITFPRFGVSFFDAVVIKFCPGIDTALLVVFVPDSKIADMQCPSGECSLKFGRAEALEPLP